MHQWAELVMSAGEMAPNTSVIYGASTLLFGGMGLIAGFIAEIRLKKK